MRFRVRKAEPLIKSGCDLINVIFADTKKPPVGYPMEADAVVALRPHSLMGYHLAQLQVGGASALSKCCFNNSFFYVTVKELECAVLVFETYDNSLNQR
jgi:hypothetical protein